MRIPYEWNHFRYIDYHPTTPWAVGFCSLSAYNELFIWDELNISPRMNTTLEIAHEIAEKSGNYKFLFDVIDPLAHGHNSDQKKRDGTIKTTADELNGYLNDFKQQGICEGGYFISGNTKGTSGREAIRARIKNSIACKVPFSNDAEDYRNNDTIVNVKKEPYLPTIWVFAHCKQVRLSLRNWREEKGKPTQAYSHHCTGEEMLLKDKKCRSPVLTRDRPPERQKVRYFQRTR